MKEHDGPGLPRGFETELRWLGRERARSDDLGEGGREDRRERHFLGWGMGTARSPFHVLVLGSVSFCPERPEVTGSWKLSTVTDFSCLLLEMWYNSSGCSSKRVVRAKRDEEFQSFWSLSPLSLPCLCCWGPRESSRALRASQLCWGEARAGVLGP